MSTYNPKNCLDSRSGLMTTTTMMCVEWSFTRYPTKKSITDAIRVRLISYSTQDIFTSIFVFVSEAIRIRIRIRIKI
jgi:hypothetical protein